MLEYGGTQPVRQHCGGKGMVNVSGQALASGPRVARMAEETESEGDVKNQISSGTV